MKTEHHYVIASITDDLLQHAVACRVKSDDSSGPPDLANFAHA